MSELRLLRSQLSRLRNRRMLVRWGNGWSAFLLAVCWTIAFLFAVDVVLELPVAHRLTVILVCLTAIIAAFFIFTRPYLGIRESVEEMALLVERQQRIDNDLVAALQFESPGAPAWGSPQMESAVIGYVRDFSPNLNVWESFTYQRLLKRAGILTATMLFFAAVALVFPNHLGVFANRLLLGGQHYPTRTQIETISVNGRQLYPSQSDAAAKSPYGRPLSFEVTCSGKSPLDGIVRLRGVTSDVQVEIPLKSLGETDGIMTFVGELPRLIDSVTYQIYLGDAWTDPATIEVIPLPVVTVALESTPPEYAADAIDEFGDNTGAQIAVIEGSRVDLEIHCRNKSLRSATLSVNEKSYALAPSDEKRTRWRLDVVETPFENVTEPLQYVIEVTDSDGLGLDAPITGMIRIKPDRPPRVTAMLPSELQHVLPTATPRIHYGAADDFGVSRVEARLQIVREDGEAEERVVPLDVASNDKPPQRILSGEYAAELKSLGLEKGDELQFTFVAYDHRGDRQEMSSVSESIVLKVTDLQGVLDGMLKTDEKSARQLDAIIQRELGIGESK